MARNDFEISPEGGQPVTLFFFRYGSDAGAYYAYTDAEAEITHGGVVYSPLKTPELLDDIETQQRFDSAEIKIRFPLECDVIDLFKIYPPTSVVTLTIREGHVPNASDPSEWALDENFPVAWLGRVLEAEREDEYAEIVCDNSAASMLRPGLRGHYQYQCRHKVYRGRCGALKSRYETPAVVQSVSANRVVLLNGWWGQALPVNNRPRIDYHKGQAEWDGPTGRVIRTILRVEGNTDIVLSGPTTDLTAGDTMYLYIGCTKLLDFCRDVHQAAPTYGGWIGVPKNHIIGKNNHT